MKIIITIVTMLITLSVSSQKDRVDIFKVNTQFAITAYGGSNGSDLVNTYEPTDMYLALRFRHGDNNDLMELQIIHSSLNKTEQYYVESSPKQTLDGTYLIINTSDKKKYNLRLNLNDLGKPNYVQLSTKWGAKTYQYNLDYHRTIYK
mgnify:CR=1 FL=1